MWAARSSTHPGCLPTRLIDDCAALRIAVDHVTEAATIAVKSATRKSEPNGGIDVNSVQNQIGWDFRLAAGVAVDVEALLPSFQYWKPISESGPRSGHNSRKNRHSVPGQLPLGQVSLVQLATPLADAIFLIDVLKIGPLVTGDVLGPLMGNKNLPKFFFDCRGDTEALTSQLDVSSAGCVDLQLALVVDSWRRYGVNRRSGLQFALRGCLKSEKYLPSKETAVATTMMLGGRPVWDSRPLPPHLVEYAAGDVRSLLILAAALQSRTPESLVDAARLTEHYIDHFSVQRARGAPDIDPRPHIVDPHLLERYLGPAGRKVDVSGADGAKLNM